jgi:hypothetical protein
MKTVVHILPQNPTICGGIKVHYQLSELERELGYDSFIAFPDGAVAPSWFSHGCKVVDYSTAKSLKPDCVIGWEDLSVLRGFDSSSKKIAYIQGEALLPHDSSFEGLHVWYSSHWNRRAIPFHGDLVSPWIDPTVFHPAERPSFLSLPVSVLFQARKDGRARWNQVAQYIPDAIKDSFTPVCLPDVPEEHFAHSLRSNDIFFAHSYPEGFGLPALEAMASRALVVGYTGGGGSEFMRPGDNAFVARDGDALTVAKFLVNIFMQFTSNQRHLLIHVLDEGIKTAASYSRDNTKEMLRHALLRLQVS